MNLLKLANPITLTKGAFGLAGAAVGLADTVARETVHGVLCGLHQLGRPGEEHTGTEQTGSTGAVKGAGPTTAAAAEVAVTDVEGGPRGPTVVPVEPHVPEQPPIDVVGQVLADEAAPEGRDTPDGVGLAHEPRGASRDEEHGDSTLQRAEVDEIAEEVAAALEGDVEPVQRLTEPLLDPADAKAMTAELKTMSRAADPDKG